MIGYRLPDSKLVTQDLAAISITQHIRKKMVFHALSPFVLSACLLFEVTLSAPTCSCFEGKRPKKSAGFSASAEVVYHVHWFLMLHPNPCIVGFSIFPGQ